MWAESSNLIVTLGRARKNCGQVSTCTLALQPPPPHSPCAPSYVSLLTDEWRDVDGEMVDRWLWPVGHLETTRLTRWGLPGPNDIYFYTFGHPRSYYCCRPKVLAHKTFIKQYNKLNRGKEIWTKLPRAWWWWRWMRAGGEKELINGRKVNKLLLQADEQHGRR